ncbi:MAG: cytochrome c oxidase subunit II [Clostridiales bacterium]
MLLADATNYVKDVDNVMIYIVAISVIMLLGVTFSMIYFVIKYNRKKNPKGANIQGNLWLEIIWVAIPTILVLTMFYYGFSSFTILRRVPKDAMVIKVTGQMWKWSFAYPNVKKFDTLYVPQNKSIKLELNSVDVNHSFYIPAFRIKEDVVPGRTDYLVFNAQQQGKFDVECAEYCGMRHAYMLNKVIVLPPDEFQKWVNTPAPAATAKNASPAAGNASQSQTGQQGQQQGDVQNNNSSQDSSNSSGANKVKK